MALLTTREAAEWLKVKPATVRRWTAEGKLPAFTKLPDGEFRYDADELYAWMEENRPGSNGNEDGK